MLAQETLHPQMLLPSPGHGIYAVTWHLFKGCIDVEFLVRGSQGKRSEEKELNEVQLQKEAFLNVIPLREKN